jgi:hypothetical protein
VRGELHDRGGALLQLLEARGHGLDLAGRLGDGIPELLETIARGANARDQQLAANPLTLQVLEDGAHLGDDVAILRAAAEQTIEQRCHQTLLRTRWAARPGGPPVQLRG